MTPTEQIAAFLAQMDTTTPDTADLFTEDAFWRDLTGFTWNITTQEGRDAIRTMLQSIAQPATFAIDGEAISETEAWFTFETRTGRGRGHIRLRDGKCWTLLTALHELKGHEEKSGPTREEGNKLGVVRGRRSWLEEKLANEAELGYTKQPYVVIVGGGQGGIGLGARLKRLGVPTLILDRHPKPGDNWRFRYKSLCLHDTVWYDHLPYIPFPAHWPVYSPKDKIGDWLEMYTKVMELDYWSNTTCDRAAYDDATKTWTVHATREGKPVTLHPTHLVLATGMSGMPNMPKVQGAETFAGTLYHSSQHQGGPGWEGKSCVVVGSNNSAHDIAADLWEHGAEVAMIQRSSTTVIRQDALRKAAKTGVYSEEAAQAGITTETADLTVAAMPYRLQPRMQKPATDAIRRDDADFYAKLTEAGFLLDFGEDGSGLSQKYVRRGSGYYIDVGASDMIIDGRITLHSGVDVTRISENAIHLSDGTELQADLIVFATGYGSMNGWAAKLISQEVADKVGLCWGLGSNTAKDPGPWEGELRNMWKPTQVEALWFHGGNLAQSRHYSRYLALQLKARMESIPTPVYALAPVHHTG